MDVGPRIFAPNKKVETVGPEKTFIFTNKKQFTLKGRFFKPKIAKTKEDSYEKHWDQRLDSLYGLFNSAVYEFGPLRGK